MKRTDEQIITTIRKILDALHDPKTGFNAFRRELKDLNLKREEYEQRITDKEYELAEKYGMTRKNNRDEIKFCLSGKDIMESRLYVSCGQAAKAFCYVNSQLAPEEQLDLKVLFSTDIDHLIDAKEGHTLPCVKLSDGKWHAIEPQIKPEKEYPGFQFVCDDVVVGGEIWHQLSSIKAKGRPYQITKIVTPEEHLTTYSDFGKFLDASMVHKGKIKFICSALKIALSKRTITNDSAKKNYYDICKGLNGNMESVKIYVFGKGKANTYRMAIEQDGVYYEIVPTVQYLCLRKIKSFDEWFKEPDGYKLQKTMSITEFVKEYEQQELQKQNVTLKAYANT